MNSMLLILLAVSLFSVMMVSGGVARLFKAKRPFIFLAFLVVALTTAMGLGMDEYYEGDRIVVFASVFVFYIVLLFILMGMGIFETMIASIASITVMGLVLFAGGMALDKYQKSDLLDTMRDYIEDKQALPKNEQNELVEDQIEDQIEEEFVIYSEALLVPKRVMEQKKNILKNKSYQTIKLENAHKLKGKRVRISKKNGDILKGSIVAIRKNSLVLGIYILDAKGVITAPVAFSVIRKLEVYR